MGNCRKRGFASSRSSSSPARWRSGPDLRSAARGQACTWRRLLDISWARCSDAAGPTAGCCSPPARGRASPQRSTRRSPAASSSWRNSYGRFELRVAIAALSAFAPDLVGGGDPITQRTLAGGETLALLRSTWLDRIFAQWPLFFVLGALAGLVAVAYNRVFAANDGGDRPPGPMAGRSARRAHWRRRRDPGVVRIVTPGGNNGGTWKSAASPRIARETEIAVAARRSLSWANPAAENLRPVARFAARGAKRRARAFRRTGCSCP